MARVYYEEAWRGHAPLSGRRAGVFACRSPFRPNLIATTVCPIRGVDHAAGTIEVANIDAIDGTPVLDIKAYYGSCDRVREPREPSWLPRRGSWLPDGVVGLSPRDYVIRREIEIMTGVEVIDLRSLPVDTAGRTIPGCDCLVFTHRGSVRCIDESYRSIYSEWLPAVEKRPALPFNFEWYPDSAVDPWSDAYELQICVPVH